MNLQVIVSTMHQTDHSLLDKMNIQTDAIIVNQCDNNKIDEFIYHGHSIKWLSLSECGVGLSRNTGLMRATADIVLFADDDVVFDEGYEQRILQTFADFPSAALIVFNIDTQDDARPIRQTRNVIRLNMLNCLRYGAVRIAVKRMTLFHNNIYFSLLFGGGTLYSAGEDNIFLTDCIKKRIKSIAVPVHIGELSLSDSTWFRGYTEKYYFDRGVLMQTIYGSHSGILSTILNLRRRNNENLSFQIRQQQTKLGLKHGKKLSRGESLNA